MKLQSRVRTKRQTLHFPLTVGSAAAVLSVSPATLRLYESQGVYTASRDSEGRRLLLPDDLAAIRQFRRAMLGKR